MMASRVYSATQLRVAVQELLRRQGDPQWADLVVVYESDKPTSPLSVNTAEYARFTEHASVICTSGDLYTYLGTGSLEDMVARLTSRIESGKCVTLEHLVEATDADNITEVLVGGRAEFNPSASSMRDAFISLRLCRGYDMKWDLQPGQGTDRRRVLLDFTAAAAQPLVRIQVSSCRPSLGFERRTIPELGEVNPWVRVEVEGSPARILTGAVAVAFARLAWKAYMEYLLAAVLQQDMA